eukprot:gene18005-biopygen14326
MRAAAVSDPRAVFRWCSRRSQSRVSTILRPDGTTTGNVAEMDRIIREAWSPILDRYATAPEPDWAPFEARFGRYIGSHPLVLAPLTAADFRRTLARMSAQQAPGMDGWRVDEIKALPDVLLDRLAGLFDRIEVTGEWPTALLRALVSLIPKGAGAGPTDLRMITVASVAYRLWAATRCRSLMQWQEAWIARGQKGFARGRGCADVYYVTMLRIEASLLDGSPLVGFSADWKKMFGQIPHKVMLTLLSRLGCDDRIIAPLRTMYARLRRRFRIAGAVGEEFSATQGLLEGCPISVCGCTAMLSVLSNAIETECAAEDD